MSYPYQKHIWVTKEVIRREYLQNISDGIYDEQQDRLLQEGLLNDDIVAESNRAKQAEQNITNNLNAEISRAEGAESTIAGDLSDEISRATAAEGELTDDVADLDTRLLDESTRALAAENEISAALANEITRATNVENDLRSITTRAYKASGSVYFADLPALDVSRLGNVYDIKDAFTTTSDFQEGAGKDYPAGTNVAIVSVEGEFYTEVTPTGTENPSQEGWYVIDDDEYVLTTDTEVESGTTYYSYSDVAYKYDVEAGFVDLSNYVQKTDKATTSQLGLIKPDGTTVTIDNDGTLHGSSGHIIKDGNGTSLTQRASLKFENCTVTDDSTNNQTVVTPTGQQITVDSSLSATSTNPVQNKVITNDLNTRVKKYALSRYHNTYCKLGTCTNFANSKHLELHLKWAQGYETQTNANLQKVIDIYVEAGNNTTAGNNSWAEYHVVDKNINNSLVYIKWLSYTSFELYVGKASYSGDGYYTVISSGGVTWTHSNSDAGTDIPDGAIRLAADKKVRYMDDTISYSEISGTPSVDSTPTSGSSNLITSGGVYSYIDTMITQALAASY